MDFYPPIHERSTEELLKMTSDGASWQPEARALARMELDKRGVPVEEVAVREQSFSAASIAQEELRDRHAEEGYPLWKIIVIFLSAPFLVTGKFLSGWNSPLRGLNIKFGLSELDRGNYKKKYRQRMGALIAGTLIWVVLVMAVS